MEKFFNTAGPVKENLHYFIPFYDRIDWEDIQQFCRWGVSEDTGTVTICRTG